MPPQLDVYGLTRQRNFETINRFIDDFVDRAASEDRGDEELMIDPLDGSANNSLDSYDWEPAVSLTHIIERGLSQPPRAFTVYLKAKQAEFDGATLSFTSDNQLIVGVSIEDEWALPQNLEQAKEVLDGIARRYDCYLGLVTVEEPPPGSENAFREAAKHPLSEFFKEF